MAHTAICASGDVVLVHETEVEANSRVFGHVREAHHTALGEADVIDLADGGTETFIWRSSLPLTPMLKGRRSFELLAAPLRPRMRSRER